MTNRTQERFDEARQRLVDSSTQRCLPVLIPQSSSGSQVSSRRVSILTRALSPGIPESTGWRSLMA